MSNQITPLNNSDVISAGDIFFVKMKYYNVPFFSPTRDNILAAVTDSDEIVVNVVDVQFDEGNNPILKCSLTDNVDTLPVNICQQYIMNIFNYISSTTNRIWGIMISQTFETSDNNFPDSNSTLTTDLGSGTKVNPGTSGTSIAGVEQAATNVTNAATNLFTGKGLLVVVGIILLLIVGLVVFLEIQEHL